jgi:hypothetical protein
VSVDQELSSDEVEAQVWVNWGMTEELFDDSTNIQKVAARDAIDAQACAQVAPIMLSLGPKG